MMRPITGMTGDAGIRRRGREIALQVLYQVDNPGDSLNAEEAMRLYAGHFGRPTADDAPTELGSTAVEAVEQLTDADVAEAREFAMRIVRGALAEREGVDALLQKASRNWRLDRMARVDRNLLRMAAWELAHAADDVPAKVAINEAIEIAKRFGTGESPAFVNGILDRCLDELGRKEPGGRARAGRRTPKSGGGEA